MNLKLMLGLAIGITSQGWSWVAVPSNTTRNLYGSERYGALLVGSGGAILQDVAMHLGKRAAGPSYRVDYRAENSGTTRDLYGVGCVNTCWVVGDSGTILHQDSGIWKMHFAGTQKTLRSVQFISDTSWGYVVGDSGTILRKNDAIWQKIASGVSHNLFAIQFQNNYVSGSDPTRFDTGFVVGAGGVILKTVDRGVSWTQLPSGVTQSLFALHFGNASPIGFAVGAGGTILKTTNKGQTWTVIPSGTTHALYDIYFSGPKHTATQPGIIVGQAGTILTTSNGGDTWTVVQSGTSQDLYTAVLGGASRGIAAGAAGTILAAEPPVSLSLPANKSRSVSSKGLYDFRGRHIKVDKGSTTMPKSWISVLPP